MFLAIVNDTYAEVKSDPKNYKTDVNIWLYIRHTFYKSKCFKKLRERADLKDQKRRDEENKEKVLSKRHQWKKEKKRGTDPQDDEHHKYFFYILFTRNIPYSFLLRLVVRIVKIEQDTDRLHTRLDRLILKLRNRKVRIR